MMGGSALVLGIGMSTLVMLGASASSAGVADERLRRDLQALAGLRVFFGHQSVGANLLEGVAELSASAGVPVPIRRVADVRAVAGPGIAHDFLGSNGDPGSKLRAYEQALPPGAQVDVALLKFCYADFDERTDPAAVFAEYARTVRALAARHPGTTFVHVTAPLMAPPPGLKAQLKQFVGRLDPGVALNAKREAYNALLRAAYEGKEPVFDLARLEATHPDGTQEMVSVGGQPVRRLVSAYTDDGGHLNRQGREPAARALISLLASLAAQARNR